MIDSGKLQVGTNYKVFFSAGLWEFNDSDEHTNCYSTVIDNWVVEIGAYDPNDEEKEDQMWAHSKKMGYLDQHFIQAPPHYDESKFREYSKMEQRRAACSIDSSGLCRTWFESAVRWKYADMVWTYLEPGIVPADSCQVVDTRSVSGNCGGSAYYYCRYH